jgi:hypothetical protein
VTRLRKTMLEEFERRNFSQSTTRTCIRTLEDFARYFHRRPISWAASTPYPKKTVRLPIILSQEEVAQLINAAETQFTACRRGASDTALKFDLRGVIGQLHNSRLPFGPVEHQNGRRGILHRGPEALWNAPTASPRRL